MTDPGPGPSGPGNPGPGRMTTDLGLWPQGVRLVASAMVAADSEGRTGGVEGAPGAVPSLPKLSGPPRFTEGRARLVGAVFPPDGPFPGSPPGPPPDPGPPEAGDGPPRPGHPNPPSDPRPIPFPPPPVRPS
jgi:hypothetical protein